MDRKRLRKIAHDARAAVALVGTGCRLLLGAAVSATGFEPSDDPAESWNAPQLFAAVASRDAKRLRRMLAAGANPNLRHPTGASLVEAAVRERAVEVVALLLEYGADPNQTRPGKDSALAVAAFRNQRPSATLLVEAGADPTLPNPGPLGGTPLSLAVEGGYERLCRILIDHASVPAGTLSELAKTAPSSVSDRLLKRLSTTGTPPSGRSAVGGVG